MWKRKPMSGAADSYPESEGTETQGIWSRRQSGRSIISSQEGLVCSDLTDWVSFMIKLLRAYGGCLGARRRRRTWQAAISLGEPQAGFDPGISEWGNPSW